MAVKIKSSNLLVGKGGIKVAVHSAAGMGKTMLAATCPKPVIIMTERTGVDSLSEKNIKAVFGDQKGITYKIPVIEAYTIPDIEEAIDLVRNDDRFETVIFDSCSEMSKIKLNDALPKHNNKLQAYGELALDVDHLLREMRDDEKNWVWLFHSGRDELFDDEGDAVGTTIIPNFEGQKLNTEFPFLIGEVYCIVSEFDEDTGKETRMLRTRQGDTAYVAKNRRGGLDELEPVHMGRIFWKLRGGSKKKVRR